MLQVRGLTWWVKRRKMISAGCIEAGVNESLLLLMASMVDNDKNERVDR
jgi:hypothetical protein